MKRYIQWLLILFILIPVHLYAQECAVASGKETVPLLELYTSEGCNSCPPADSWFSRIDTREVKVVPLGFHVDYWDSLGWKDRFASPVFTARQRQIVAQGRSEAVYTPQFVLNGRDFRGVATDTFNKTYQRILSIPARAQLNLMVDNMMRLQVNAVVPVNKDAKDAQVFVAVYENKLSSTVQAGENKGHTLHHDYVVREFWGAYPLGSRNALTKSLTLPNQWRDRLGGAVVFVQNAKNGEVLQSLQLPFSCLETFAKVGE